MQDPDHPQEAEYSTMLAENAIRFQPDDILSVSINCAGHPEIAEPFNLPLQPVAESYGAEEYVDMHVGRQTYQVDKDGNILMPVIGKLHVAGYTLSEFENKLREILREKYIKEEADPIVTVRLTNFTIYFLGDSDRRTGMLSVKKDHINIFEALSIQGDLSRDSKRWSVRLIRPLPDGKQKHVRLDLTNIDIVSSPYFYLHQNDMLYVEPTKSSLLRQDQQNFYLITSLSTFILSMATLVMYFKNLN
jgi:polysaccharide export outer membrane protein